MKNFIRLNINDNYLSLGNLFRVIKEESNNTNTFWQHTLFSIDSHASTNILLPLVASLFLLKSK